MAKTFLCRAYDEMVGMSQAVTTSALDWTIVRFLAPEDGPARGELRQGFYGTDAGLRRHPCRHRGLHRSPGRRPRYIGVAPAISN
jgi:hypothetical protein